MTWVNLSSVFTYESKLTSTQMQNLRDNLTALANGDSGAPAIQSTAVASGAIVYAKIGALQVGTVHLIDQNVTLSKIDPGLLLELPNTDQSGLSGGSANSGWTSVSGSGWRVYKPAGTLYLRCQMDASTADTAGYRILVNSSTGSEITFDDASSDWRTESVINVSSMSGWLTIMMQRYEDLYWQDIRWRWAAS